MVLFDIEGVLAPVFTPFNEDGSLKLTVIPSYLQFLADHDIHGILVGGTTGESLCLSLEERKEVLAAWLDAARPASVKVIAQVGGVPLPDVIAMAKYAHSRGADAIMTLPEIYYKPKTTEEVVRYLETVSDAAPGLPLVYYHFPIMSGVELNIPEFFKLASSNIPSFKAMKADLDVAVQVTALMKDEQKIFIGNHMVAPAVLLGHSSSIATVTNIFPSLMQDIVETTKSGDVKNARIFQNQMNKVVAAITSEGAFLPSMKVAMQLITGINLGPPRKPLASLNHSHQIGLAKKLTALGIHLKNEEIKE